jgi:putative transposase
VAYLAGRSGAYRRWRRALVVEATLNLTFKIRAYPTRKQHALFAGYLDHTRQLYNAALDERINCYRKTGQTLTAIHQSRELTELRNDPDYAIYPRRMQRWAINLVDRAYLGMFTRHKKREKLGFPRFRGHMFWNTFGFDSPEGFKMRDRGLYNRKAFGGTLRLRPSRPLPPFESLTMATFSRDGERWFANLTYELADVPAKERPARPVGLDIGLITLAMRSDGVPMNVPRQDKADTAEQRRASRALSRCSKRSKRRRRVRARLRRINARIAARRKARLHVISARLTHHFDAVAIEDLNLRGLGQGGGSGAKGRGVRKSWRDRAPGQLAQMLAWKCQRDGRQFARVDPRHTSVLCASCGTGVAKTLRERMHRCGCGAVLDRDHNAALNILARAWWGPGDAKPDGRSAAVAVSGAGLSLKHGGREAAGPRRGSRMARPPPSTLRGST